jgi:hypothetical protein
MAYDIKKLNEDLNKALAEHEVKPHITFHKSGDTHGKGPKAKNRKDRQDAKRDLRQGDHE